MTEINETQLISQPSIEQSQSALQQTGLDQEAFLKIFLTQLEHQDPLNPQDATEMSSQLAQFSQLEQSIRMKTELEAINTKLQELVNASGGSDTFTLDPIAMIGREVDIAGNLMLVTDQGSEQTLQIELEREAKRLIIGVADSDGNGIGFASLPPLEQETGETLAAGTYELSIVDGEPQLRSALGGTPIPLEFTPLAVDEDGNTVVDPDADPLPFPPDDGHSYRFTAVAADITGAQFDPALRTTAVVEAVHVSDGLPVLSVAGQDVDPLQVIRIR